MNIEEYEREGYFLYEQFAEIIKLVLEKALEKSEVPSPQSIQYRAKTIKSLRERLSETAKLESADIESCRRDLAGARVIFYTNTDVSLFERSGLIFENFDIEFDAVKIHQPTKENSGVRYRANHYTVKLKDNRTNLPEYSKFKGMRCEIQIQTILNHAWSETSHDIVYKTDSREGFGNKSMQSIKDRLNRIMDDYLLPAGYQFQRVQHDYERLRQGKELFDQNVVTQLENATDNNERHEILTTLKEQVLPNYDDMRAVYRDLVTPLVATVVRARKSEAKPIVTPFGNLEGKSAADVSELVISIFDLYRYFDVQLTFDSLCKIFVNEEDDKVRAKIKESVERLSQYDISAWEHVGAGVQNKLIAGISEFGARDEDALQPLVVAVYRSALASELTGTSWNANSVTWKRGSIPATSEIKEIRKEAMSGLFELFLRANSDEQKKEIISALNEAARTSSQARYSNDFLRLTIVDSTTIVNFFTTHLDNLSYELRESMEESCLYRYRRTKDIANDGADKFGSRDAAVELLASIIRFRDKLNSEQNYVRYKMLVGYQTVIDAQWDDKDFDFKKVKEFRQRQTDRYIDEINNEHEQDWFGLFERCAATRSNDLATFPVFGEFLNNLARRRPQIANRLLEIASSELLRFLPGLLSGLYESGSNEIYESRIASYSQSGTQLRSLARHWRNAKPSRPDFIQGVLEKAIEQSDDWAVCECLYFAIEEMPSEKVPPSDTFLTPALEYFNRRNLSHWVHDAWFDFQKLRFFEAISLKEVKLILNNFVELSNIDFPAEQMLCQLARRHLSMVWDFLGKRLKRQVERREDENYHAIPYSFQGLEKELSKDIKLAISKARGWFKKNPRLFRYYGGNLLSIVFSGFPAEFADELVNLVTTGNIADAKFVISVMENYHSEPTTHEILKAIVTKYPDERSMRTGVSISFDGTGVVTGEFGFVHAMRKKRDVMETWLSDARPEVRDFAANHIHQLNQTIASEQRRAEESIALRKLEYGTDEDLTVNDDESDEPEAGSDDNL